VLFNARANQKNSNLALGRASKSTQIVDMMIQKWTRYLDWTEVTTCLNRENGWARRELRRPPGFILHFTPAYITFIQANHTDLPVHTALLATLEDAGFDPECWGILGNILRLRNDVAHEDPPSDDEVRAAAVAFVRHVGLNAEEERALLLTVGVLCRLRRERAAQYV
jgi:hypothetical protein